MVDRPVEDSLLGDGRGIESLREVPQHVHGHARAATREAVNLRGIRKLLFKRGRSSRLKELAEARARVGLPPGRRLYLETVETFGQGLFVRMGGKSHAKLR